MNELNFYVFLPKEKQMIYAKQTHKNLACRSVKRAFSGVIDVLKDWVVYLFFWQADRT